MSITQESLFTVVMALLVAGAAIVMAIMLAIACATVGHTHDRKRPDLNSWFDGLRSGRGPCCSNADGRALSDVDWEAKDGHYRVRVENQWWDVPDEAVIKEPNLAGPTMVWPRYNWAIGGKLDLQIQCFMPGTMT